MVIGTSAETGFRKVVGFFCGLNDDPNRCVHRFRREGVYCIRIKAATQTTPSVPSPIPVCSAIVRFV